MKLGLSIKNETCRNSTSLENIGTIQLENGEYFVTLNEKTNTIYVSNNLSDSILVIDGTAKKIICRIQIERPRELALNSNNNTLYAINGKAGFWKTDEGAQISVIDTSTNKIIDSIGKKEGFGDIKLNKNTNLLYATQTKEKKIWVIDTLTNTVKDKIKGRVKYRSITIDEINNMIYIVGRGGRTNDSTVFEVIDGKNNHVEKIVSKFYFSGRSVSELYYNQTNKKLYAFVKEPGTSDGFFEGTSFYIQEIDLESKSFGNKTRPRGIQNGMGFDPSRNYLYISDVDNGEFSVFNHSLKEIGLFRFTEEIDFVDKYLKGHTYHSKIAINSHLQLIYIAGSKMNLLHTIKE